LFLLIDYIVFEVRNILTSTKPALLSDFI